MGRTIGQTNEEMNILCGYVRDLKPGRTLTWFEISRATGIKMDYRGKQALRRAMDKERVIYDPKYGQGIQVGSHENAMKIIGTRMVKIDNSVRRGEQTVTVAKDKFFDKLPGEEKKKVIFFGSVFAAIRLAADQAKALYKKKPMRKIADSSKVSLPE